MAKPKKPTKTTQKKTQSKYRRVLPMSPTAGVNRGHRLKCGGKLKK